MKSRSRNGVVLIVVVILLPLVGVAMVFLTRQSAQLAVATRQMQQDAEWNNLYLSACAYLEANRQTLVRPDAEAEQNIPLDGITTEPATATIQIDKSDPSARTILLTIQLQKRNKLLERKWTLRFPDRDA